MGLELWLNQVTSFKPRLWLKRVFARRADQTRVSPFHAVGIRYAKNSCQAAQDTHGERYVSAEAPLLPLGQCDRPDRCQCRYQHYEDRRRGSRRRAESGLPRQSDAERVERRKTKGRRAEDIAEDGEPCSVSEDSYYEYVGDKFYDQSLDASESTGVDPYNTGSFDKSKS
jgi:hypothetical protein